LNHFTFWLNLKSLREASSGLELGVDKINSYEADWTNITPGGKKVFLVNTPWFLGGEKFKLRKEG
jgi:hypothetical protein